MKALASKVARPASSRDLEEGDTGGGRLRFADSPVFSSASDEPFQELQTDERQDNDDENENDEENEEDGTIKQRVIAPVREMQYLSTMKTLGRACLGNNVEGICFQLGAKKRLSVVIFWVLWWTGNSIGVLVLGNVIPQNLIWACLLMIPLPTVCFPLLGVSLFSELLNELEVQVLSIMQTLYVIAAASVLWDMRALYWACTYPTLAMSVFTDAYPMRHRAFFARCFFASKAVVLISWDAMNICGYCYPTKPVTLPVGHVSIGCLPFTITTSATLLIFAFRHLTRIARFPDRFVILKSPLQTYHEEMELVDDADDEDGEHHFHLRKKQNRIKTFRKTVPLADVDLIRKAQQVKRSKSNLE